MKRTFIIICALLLIMEANSFFWRRRRRRRSPPPCSAVNCLVDSWTSCSSCSHQCCTSGTRRGHGSKRASRPVVEHVLTSYGKRRCATGIPVKTVVLLIAAAVVVERDMGEPVAGKVSAFHSSILFLSL